MNIGEAQRLLGVCLNVPLSVCAFYYLFNESDFIFYFICRKSEWGNIIKTFMESTFSTGIRIY